MQISSLFFFFSFSHCYIFPTLLKDKYDHRSHFYFVVCSRFQSARVQRIIVFQTIQITKRILRVAVTLSGSVFATSAVRHSICCIGVHSLRHAQKNPPMITIVLVPFSRQCRAKLRLHFLCTEIVV